MTMKGTPVTKTLKITGISLLSVLGVLVLAFLILSWTILSPSRLTSTTRKVLDKYAPCPVMIDKVELTLVRTYPFLAFRIDGLFIPDEMESSPLDTLLSIEKFFVQADIDTLIHSNAIVVTSLDLNDTQVGLFTDESGRSNLDFLLSSDTVQTEETSSAGIPDLSVNLEKAGISRLKASYTDLSAGMSASVADFNASMKGRMEDGGIQAHARLYANDGLSFAMNDDTTDIKAVIKALSLELDGIMTDNGASGSLTLNVGDIQAAMDSMNAVLSSLKASTSVECGLGENGLTFANATGLTISAKDIMAAMTGMQANLAEFSVRADSMKYDPVAQTAGLSGTSIGLGKTGMCMTDSLGNSTEAAFESLLATLGAACNLEHGSLSEELTADIADISFSMDGESPIKAGLGNLGVVLNSNIDKDRIDASPSVRTDRLTFAMGNDTYVPGWPVSLSADVHTNPNLDHVRMPLTLNVNGQRLNLDADVDISNNMQDFRGYAGISAQSLDIERIISMIPDNFKELVKGISASGQLALNAGIRGSYINGEPKLKSASATVGLSRFNAGIADSLYVETPALTANVIYPSAAGTKSDGESADLNLVFGNLDFMYNGSQTEMDCHLSEVSVDARADGPVDSLDLMVLTAYATVKAGGISATVDTASVDMQGLMVDATISPNDGLPAMMLNLALSSLGGRLDDNEGNSVMDAGLGRTSATAMARYDQSQEDLLLKWNPRFSLQMDDSHVSVNDVTVELPQLDVDFSLGRFAVNDSRLVVDGSDISFWGDIYNIGAYVQKTGLLTGELFLESDHVDVNRLMAITSGIGVDDAAVQEAEIQATADSSALEPFLVPEGVDLTLYTNFSSIEFGDHEFFNLGGDVTVKDGTAVLKELGFSSDAAEMQLTAIYTAPRVDSMFMAMDFHLLDIQIDELIDLIPTVDSVAPMLKSFDGVAQFHFAIESFMKPDYTPIMSTMLGAAAVEGKDLVVMDNEVFDGIKHKLLMSRKARNVIDSLDVELQIIRNKVTLFPFKVSMDKYSAVIGGRHNLSGNLDCSYHVALVKTPLPIRLGVTVSGPLMDISEHPLKHIKLKRPEYKKLYEPEKRGNYEERVLQLKSNVLEMLRSNVREY